MKSTSIYDDPRGFVCKIGDFGLSRVLDCNATHVSTGTYGESPLQTACWVKVQLKANNGTKFGQVF